MQKVSLAAFLIALTSLQAAQSQITEFAWNAGAGSHNWQANNWDMAGFPNDPEHVANLSVGLGGSLTVNVGTTGNDVTIAGLNIGGTGSAVTTDLISSGALLRIQNNFEEDLANADFNNNSSVDGSDFLRWQRGFGMSGQDVTNANGDADGDMDVDADDLDVWQMSYGLNSTGINGGRGIITTLGAAGTVNRISANVRIVNENVDVKGGADLLINGNITMEDDTPELDEVAATLSNTTAGITTTINGNIDMVNQFDGIPTDFGLNTASQSQGTLIVNGVISDGNVPMEASRLYIGVPENGAIRPLSTVRLNSANTYGGGTTLSRVNLEIANNDALGGGTLRQAGPANQFGYNIIPVGGELTLPNDITMAQWQTFKGSHNVTLTGNLTQTNNRGIVNQLDADKTLTITGLLEIWEDDEALVREFEFDGEGNTVFTGMIRDDPLSSGNDRRIHKSGTGVLTIDVNAGDNTHSGPTTVEMGNLHYADNDSLNQGFGMILARGGAVGVDTGVANNATFAGKIDPTSTGGFMLAPSDGAANLDFTSTLSNAGNMTVAAPETGLTYTGTITPANSTYGLGGGTGTLTLPNAQLTGANDLEVRNGGTVELLGDNTYTGSTTILTRYTSTHQEQAEADSSNENDADGVFYDRLVAPILVVDDLANGGVASSLGSASSAAENIFIQGSTLKYVGTGDSTDRLFTIGTGGATIDSSGTGAVVFSNTGLLGRDDAEERTGDIDDFSPGLAPTALYNVEDITGTISSFTKDIVVGMPVMDPDGGGFTFGNCADASGANCIPAGTVVTGVSADGTTIGLSNGYPFVQKLNTRLVFGTVERTLTLAGTNGDDNTLASEISDSPMGGVVAVEKIGSGKWVLGGSNTYTGDTTVDEGILSITSAFLADASDVLLGSGATLELDFSGADVIDDLFVNGLQLPDGIYGATDGGMGYNVLPQLAGSGFLNVGNVPFPLEGIAAVPEPAAVLLAVAGLLSLASGRWRSESSRV